MDAVLFEAEENVFESQEDLYKTLKRLTDEQYAYLIPMSIWVSPKASYPTMIRAGVCIKSQKPPERMLKRLKKGNTKKQGTEVKSSWKRLLHLKRK